MARIILWLEGQEPTRKEVRQYQAEQLGRSHGQTLLAELMPIPKPNVRQWPYEVTIPQFGSRDDYYNQVMPERIKLLKSLFESYQPRIVIAYGKKYWREFKQVLPAEIFSEEEGFEFAKTDRTLFILCGHFAARSMNGRIESLIELIRSQQP